MTTANLALIEKLLEDAKQYFQPEPEKTFFSIGGRGHYENPISDVLAFYFDPSEAHGLGKLLIESLFQALKFTSPSSFDLTSSPIREFSTENGKRIDLILEGDTWVIVIENKIFHDQINPFEEYESSINKQYPDKQPMYVILSPNGKSINPEKWKPLSYLDLINAIKNNLGHVLVNANYNKWVVFLRDFIINLEQYTTRRSMDNSEKQFIQENYQRINQLIELKEKYIKQIQNEGLEILNILLPENKIDTTIHSWAHGPAIRYYSDNWIGKSNIVIQICHRDEDKGIGIYMYAYKLAETEMQIADQAILKPYHHTPWIESKTIRCYKSKNRFDQFDKVINEFKESAKAFNDFNLKHKL